MSKKYEVGSGKDDETLNSPIHKYIGFGNIIIGILIFGFGLVILLYKVPSSSRQICYIRDVQLIQGRNVVSLVIQTPWPFITKEIKNPKSLQIADYQMKDNICVVKVDSVNQEMGLLYCHSASASQSQVRSLVSSKNKFKSLTMKLDPQSILPIFFENFSSRERSQ